MDKNQTIISEQNRPFWQVIVAALFFTIGIGLLIRGFYYADWNENTMKSIGKITESAIYFLGLGAMFCYQKSICIDLKNSRFRSTFQIGPIKLGEWKTIHAFEYVSVFQQPLKNGNTIFEVNLWYDTNKHWELYEKHDVREAFRIGYELSELLNIELLDATIPNDFKWIDKASLIDGTNPLISGKD